MQDVQLCHQFNVWATHISLFIVYTLINTSHILLGFTLVQSSRCICSACKQLHTTPRLIDWLRPCTLPVDITSPHASSLLGMCPHPVTHRLAKTAVLCLLSLHYHMLQACSECVNILRLIDWLRPLYSAC